MNSVVRDRIAVLRHKRRQGESRAALSVTSDRLGETPHTPVDPGVSLQVQGDLYEKLKAMRASGSLHSVSFADVNAAVDEFLSRAPQLAPDSVFEFYIGARGSGFFRGPLSRAFVMACLQQGHEGIALVSSTLASGVVLDVALDDPIRGDFYEVEWW